MSKKHDRLEEVRTALFTAVLVVIGMQIILDIVKPYLGLILLGIIAATVGKWLYSRSKHL